MSLMTPEAPPKIGQHRFNILSPTREGVVEPTIFWVQKEPEPVIPVKKGYRTIRLSSIPNLLERLQGIENGVASTAITPEDLLAREEGTQLHRLYALGKFLQLGGTPEALPYCFPTLKPDSPEMKWMQEAVVQNDLVSLWQRIMTKAEADLRASQPLFIQPESGISFDELYSLWRASDCLKRGHQLVERLELFSHLVPHETEERADKLYFETGVICFIPELKLIVICRFDELASTRKRGEKRLTFAIDFKSGKKPDEFSETDLVYPTLMTMIAERVTTRHLMRGGISPGSGYVPVSMGHFLSKAFIGRATTVFRYGEGGRLFHIPPWPSSLKVREQVFKLLQSWAVQMKELNITKI